VNFIYVLDFSYNYAVSTLDSESILPSTIQVIKSGNRFVLRIQWWPSNMSYKLQLDISNMVFGNPLQDYALFPSSWSRQQRQKQQTVAQIVSINRHRQVKCIGSKLGTIWYDEPPRAGTWCSHGSKNFSGRTTLYPSQSAYSSWWVSNVPASSF